MIPFNRPSLQGRELELMAEAVASGHISGDGKFTRLASRMLEQAIGARRVLLTTSCTHALEMAALLLDVEPGDEVILPAFTFVSGANAFVLRGAVPVFADIRPDTLNIDERLLEGLITPRTRAIQVMHYAGVGCEMDVIGALAQRHAIPIVEDNAHGLFGKYRGKSLGTFGLLATQSFHETKNISCGEGGALVINDDSLISRAEIIREKGTDRSRFFRGEVDKYSWVDVGSSFLPSDLLAAYLVAQLEHADRIQARRKRISERYRQALRSWAAAHGIRLPFIPEWCEEAHHLFYLMMPDRESRDALIAFLREANVYAVFHYLPLNRSAMARRTGAMQECPVAESASDRLVRLPFYTDLSEDDQDTVVEAVLRWRP